MIRRLCIAALLFGPGIALADEYPTVDRVQYVLECMKNHDGKYEYIYKCSCAIDSIANSLPYKDYVEASSVARYSTMGGERMGVFRESDQMRALTKKWKSVEAEANKGCFIE
jgi:hypothetical protein